MSRVNIRKLACLMFVLTCICDISNASAIQIQANQNTLTIGVAEEPPFTIKNDDGSWSGLAIDLWKEISKELGVKNDFKEFDYESLLQALANKEIDVGVTVLPITASDDKLFDFTHAYLTTNLAIATHREPAGVWHLIYKNLTNKKMLKAILTLLGLLFVAGLLVWIFEHRRNHGQFSREKGRGIGQGFWWAAVTMTTVGYGDKVPITFGGRIVALIWMFISIALISVLIGTISSSLTLSELQTLVRDPRDLAHVRVGAMVDSEAALYLEHNKVDYSSYSNESDGLKDLANKNIDAFVGDEPVIRYLINHKFKNQLTVLPKGFDREYLGFGLPEDSRLRKRIDLILLSIIHSNRWLDLTRTYLGVDAGMKTRKTNFINN